MPRHALTALAVALATALLAACGGGSEEAGSGDDPGPDGITVYSGRIAPLIGPAIDMHEEEVGKDIQVRFGDSPQLASQLIEEGDGTPADLFMSQDAGALEAVDAEGLLARLPDDILERVPARFRAENGDWVGTSARSRVVAYDSRELEPRGPARVGARLHRPRVGRTRRLGSAERLARGLRLRAALGGGRRRSPREWLEGMVANDTQTYDSNVPIRDAIAAGEIDVGLINHYYVAQAKAEEGEDYPVDIYFPPGDLGALVNVAGVGVLESSERKEEAFDFIRFLLSRKGQEFFVESSKEYRWSTGSRARRRSRPSMTCPVRSSTSPISPTSRGRSR